MKKTLITVAATATVTIALFTPVIPNALGMNDEPSHSEVFDRWDDESAERQREFDAWLEAENEKLQEESESVAEFEACMLENGVDVTIGEYDDVVADNCSN